MDIFASHTISLVLSWVFCSFIFIGLIGYVGETLFEKAAGIPRAATIWISLCIILLSPLRYMLLQLTIATAYPFQSVSAFVSTFLLAMYIPIVFGILYAVGFALPLLGAMSIGMREQLTKAKMFLVCLLTPVGCLLGSYLFALILPYAAISVHWVKAKDVIRATNGPAYYFHRLAVDVWNPIDLFVDAERRDVTLRGHVVAAYFGKKQRRSIAAQHFSQSLSYANDATAAFEKGIPDTRSLIVSIDQKVIEEVMRLKRLALSEATMVSVAELNNLCPGFGDHYRDEFIQGLEAEVAGYERNERFTTMRGQFLLNSWGDWYLASRERILQGSKE